jgi:ABC-2 type transport system permease protein
MSFFPKTVQKILSGLPFEHIAYTPLELYLGKLDRAHGLAALATEWFWVVVLLVLAHLWWSHSVRKITIHGG